MSDDEKTAYGAPLYDSVDTEWSKKYVDNVHLEMGSVPGKLLREKIVNGEVRIGREIDENVGRGNLLLPLPGNHPLIGVPKAVLVPHLGSATERTRRAMFELAISNLVAGVEGRELPAELGVRLG